MPDQSASPEGTDSLSVDKRLSCASVTSSTNLSCVFCIDNISLETSPSGVQDIECDDILRTKLESLCDLHKHLSCESELKTTELSNDSLATGLCTFVNGVEVQNDSTTNTITNKDSLEVSTLELDQNVVSAEALSDHALENNDSEDQGKSQLINENISTAWANINLTAEKEQCTDESLPVNTTSESDENLASRGKDAAAVNEDTDEKKSDLQPSKAPDNETTFNEHSAAEGTLSDDIEPSTKWTDEQLAKINTIELLLTKSDLDLPTLQELAAQSDGFVTDSIRRRVWPRLLHLQDTAPIPLLSREESEQHASHNQVVLDVERTLKRFPPGISFDKRRVLMDQLIRVILTVMTRNPDMHYYQGYHDVGITLLLVCGHEAAPLLLEELSLTHLREFLQPTMERTQRWLAFLFPMLADTCPHLYQHMMKASVGAVFCLAWLITWYAHTLSQYRQVVRLYDFLLASPPLMPMYIAAEILRYREKELLEVECDMAMLHHALSQVPDDLPLDELLQKARLLYRRLPPPSLAEQVDQHILEEKQREQAERKERERRMRAARRPAPSSSWVARVWALATPRRLNSVHGAAAIAVLAMATAVYLRSYGAPRMLLW